MRIENTIKDYLNKVINLSLNGLKIDNVEVNLKNLGNDTLCENVSIEFFEKVTLNIFTNDLPHFFGEANLEFDLVNNTNIYQTPIPIILEGLRLWQWKSQGLNLLSEKYLVQIELLQKGKVFLSVGFISQIKEEIDFLSTGELYVSSSGIENIKEDKRLSFIEIS